MTLTNKLRHIGYALSVGTLSVLAVNVEPANAHMSDRRVELQSCTIVVNGNIGHAICDLYAVDGEVYINMTDGSNSDRLEITGNKICMTRGCVMGDVTHNGRYLNIKAPGFSLQVPTFAR